MLIRSETLETSTGRAAGGLLAGAATGAGLNGAWIALSSGAYDRPLKMLGLAVGMFLITGLFWLIGAFTLGWALLHAAKIRGPLAAVLYGSALLGGFFRLFTAEWRIWAPFAVAGAIAGLVVWNVSYRRVRPGVEVFGEAGA
ncbi:MAG: hypothetical protein EON95_15060 [Caulobacteraceae bacterium]|nr:MAG: hypothetical protein EON95_15060 [Caulobacteraceae bacterium]